MPFTLRIHASRLPGMAAHQAAFMNGQAGPGAACASPHCVSELPSPRTTSPLAWWTRQPTAAGQETPPRGRSFERMPCEPYELPWEQFDRECWPRRRGRRLGPDELEELCGLPCATGGEGLPRAAEIARATEDLEITFRWGDGVPREKRQEWEELLRCGWAVLRENRDLVRFLMCVLTGNPEAGDCLERKIVDQRPDIHVSFMPTNEVGGTVLDLEESLLAALIGGLMFGPGAFLLAGAASLLRFDDVVWFAELPNHQAMHRAWTSGDYRRQACACLHAAAMLLHETSHTCLRDLSIHHDGDDCSLSEMLNSGFLYLVTQRYHATSGPSSPDCCHPPDESFLADWDPVFLC